MPAMLAMHALLAKTGNTQSPVEESGGRGWG
jgi:hypothetical protein